MTREFIKDSSVHQDSRRKMLTEIGSLNLWVPLEPSVRPPSMFVSTPTEASKSIGLNCPKVGRGTFTRKQYRI